MQKCAFAIVIDGRGRILLVRSLSVKGQVEQWSLPGGVVDDGENTKAAAKREVLEETGIICEIDGLISEAVDTTGKKLISIYRAKFVSGSLTPETGEIAEAKWFTKDSALKLPLAYDNNEIIGSL